MKAPKVRMDSTCLRECLDLLGWSVNDLARYVQWNNTRFWNERSVRRWLGENPKYTIPDDIADWIEKTLAYSLVYVAPYQRQHDEIMRPIQDDLDDLNERRRALLAPYQKKIDELHSIIGKTIHEYLDDHPAPVRPTKTQTEDEIS